MFQWGKLGILCHTWESHLFSLEYISAIVAFCMYILRQIFHRRLCTPAGIK